MPDTDTPYGKVDAEALQALQDTFDTTTILRVVDQFDAIRAAAHKRLRGLFETADKQLADKAWLAGFRSFADPYFYITLRWAAGTKVDLSGLDNLAAYKARMDADPGVQAVLKAEGLA